VKRSIWERFIRRFKKFDYSAIPRTKTEIERFIRLVPITWYQKVDLPFGIETPGRDTGKKFEVSGIENTVKGKTVLDIGCNVGAFCFLSEKAGAGEVHGIDIDPGFINTAKVLADIKKSGVKFHTVDLNGAMGYFGKGKFDISYAFAVLHKMTGSEDQWRVLADPGYAEELSIFENALKTIIGLTRETVFIELTYRFRGYPGSGDKYPAYENIDPHYFAEKYCSADYFSSIEMVGEIDNARSGGKRRIIYKCEVAR